MITLELLNSIPEILRTVLMKDDLYKSISPEIDFGSMDLCNTLYFQIISEYDIPCGIFILKPFTKNCFQFHGGLYKAARGNGRKILTDIIQIVKDSYKVELISYTLESNKLAQNLLKKCGFKEKTTIYNGYPQGNLILFAER